ncbi:MAG TPA: hypothetical protein PL028_01440 [Bacteroidales bacterium]|nr:hypothetical protein [Bacteroidales bacterium]
MFFWQVVSPSLQGKNGFFYLKRNCKSIVCYQSVWTTGLPALLWELVEVCMYSPVSQYNYSILLSGIYIYERTEKRLTFCEEISYNITFQVSTQSTSCFCL